MKHLKKAEEHITQNVNRKMKNKKIVQLLWMMKSFGKGMNPHHLSELNSTFFYEDGFGIK